MNLPNSTMIDISCAKFSEKLFGAKRFEIINEKLPKLKNIVPAKVFSSLDDNDLGTE